MTLTPRKRPASAASTSYERRRRRNQRIERVPDRYDANHNPQVLACRAARFDEEKRYQIGAFIYSATNTTDSEAELSLHVFDNHPVQVRKAENESQAVSRVASQFSAETFGKNTFISSLYMMQKHVPVQYSSCSLSEQTHRVNLNLKRKFVPMLEHEYDPNEKKHNSQSKKFRSDVTLNIL